MHLTVLSLRTALLLWTLIVFLLAWIQFFSFEDILSSSPEMSWSPDFSDQQLHIGSSPHKHKRILCLNSAEEVLCYIPREVTSAWAERELLVVLGIPSRDTPVNQQRRYLQRNSWMLFGAVATRKNNFTGDMLVLFVLARHYEPPCVYSPELQGEAVETQDVLTSPLHDARPTTRKRIGGGGYWGMETEIGVSRKSLTWYSTALRLFPRASYIAKADDDVFIRTPQYIADLRSLPRAGVYWGRLLKWSARKRDPRTLFYFVGGMCITMSRDIAHHITSYVPLQKLLLMPYRVETQEAFKALNMDHEDVMLGRVLYETRHREVIYVKEGICRFHDIHAGWNKGPVTKRSLVVHHLREKDYAVLAPQLLSDNTVTFQVMVFHGRRETRNRAAAAHKTVGDSMPVNLSFGNFDFQEMKSLGQRGGGVRELATLLRRARRQTVSHSALLKSKEGVEQRNAELLTTAMHRASGAKVRDDPKRLAKAMAKRRNKKRQSAKKWTERIDRLQKSVNNVVEDRAASRQMARARRDAKSKAKAQAKGKDKSQKQNGKGSGGGSKWSKKSGPVKGKGSGGGAKKGGRRKK